MHNTQPQYKQGFTLMELLLTVGVASVLLIAFSGLLQNLADDEFASNTAEYMTELGEATEDMLRDTINFDILYQYTEAETNNALEIPVSYVTDGVTLGLGTILPSSLISSGFSATSPLRTDVTILLSIADDPNSATDARALNVAIVTEDQKPDDRVVKIAKRIGAQGGYYRDDPLEATDFLQSAFASWEIAFADLAGTTWHTAVSGRTLSITDGSYLVYYAYLNEEDVFGDYLYRTPQYARPDLHMMNAALNLGGYHILGADNMYVASNATVENDVIVQGSAYIPGNLSLSGNLYVEERLEAGSVQISDGNASTSETLVVQGDMLVQSSFIGDDIQTVNAYFDTLSLQGLQADNITVSGGNVEIAADSVGASIGVLNNAGPINIANTMQGQIINLDDGFSPGGDIGIVNYTNSNVTTINTNLNVLDAQAEGATRVYSLLACDSGCDY